MTPLAFKLSELFPLDHLSYNAFYFECRQDYCPETIQFCRRGRDNVSCIQNMAALMFIPPATTHPPPPPRKKKKKKSSIWISVKTHVLESSKLNL